MPLINDKDILPNQRWFHPECDTDKLAPEELSWNLRHAELFANDWSAKPTSHDWIGDGIDFGLADECDTARARAYPGHRCPAFRDFNKTELLRVEFEALAKKWRRETQHLSLISKKVAHPAYLRIIAMGQPATPLLLEALRDRPSHWFAALQAIANIDPCDANASPAQARDAWLHWGKSRGYI